MKGALLSALLVVGTLVFGDPGGRKVASPEGVTVSGERNDQWFVEREYT